VKFFQVIFRYHPPVFRIWISWFLNPDPHSEWNIFAKTFAEAKNLCKLFLRKANKTFHVNMKTEHFCFNLTQQWSRMTRCGSAMLTATILTAVMLTAAMLTTAMLTTAMLTTPMLTTAILTTAILTTAMLTNAMLTTAMLTTGMPGWSPMTTGYWSTGAA
jgi:hypothetical protein